MSASDHLRTLLINELLAGREICAAVFAQRVDVDVFLTRNVLRELSPYLSCRSVKESAGPNRIYYSARNRRALRAMLNSKAVRPTGVKPAPTVRFDELLKAWGIAPRRLNLPTTVHRVATKEDGPEPILV